MHLQGYLKNIHPQSSFIETKHCWNSHDTVYLGFKKRKRKRKRNLPYSTKGASSYYNKNQNNGQEDDNAAGGNANGNKQRGDNIQKLKRIQLDSLIL